MRFIIAVLLLCNVAQGQALKRPKLVVGIVVDQMRWDFLYRYYDRYTPDGGFRRLINKGYSCENTFINYIPTYTACGHTSLYTGTTPAVHGITGNIWYDTLSHGGRYCTSDTSVRGVGTDKDAGKMSPRHMLTTTICDELRLATNFRSKVIGIAIKDRGGILPAGHSANAAYWYEPASGNWVTSTYYMQQLPEWVNSFNAKNLTQEYLKKGWNTLYPINTYSQSQADTQSYEGKSFGAKQKGFPYTLEPFIAGKNNSNIASTPYGNSFTKDMAMATVTAEGLGKDSITDFLAVSFSSPDYIGHSYGPNSIEVEDTYLRLDKDLGELFRFLDNKVGKDQYLVFISADHGVAHVGGFSKEKKLPGGGIPYNIMEKTVDTVLRKQFGNYKFILASENGQLYFDHRLMDSLKTDKNAVAQTIIQVLSGMEGVDRVFKTADVMNETLIETIKMRAVNGYYPSRSGDIQILFRSGYMSGSGTGTTHGSWNPYDSHIPLVWYGWNIKPGKTNRETYMTDVAPTIAAMLRIQMPSGCTGKAIEEVTR